LNKIDLITPDELDSLKAILKRLNPSAQMLDTKFGVVSPSTILNTRKFNQKEVEMLPGWNQELHGSSSGHTPETEEYGISSFIYSADRPFHADRLWSLVETGLVKWGVVRSKGLVWCDSDHTWSREWSQAGSSMSLQRGRRWRDRPDDLGKHVESQFGDRRQEIVFIGQNMKDKEIRKTLEDALLSENEFDEWIAHAPKRARTRA